MEIEEVNKFGSESNRILSNNDIDKESVRLNIITEHELLTEDFFDLTNDKYHGGTTLSSGVKPKWDFLKRAYMIKGCEIDDFGMHLTDSLNEELVYRFCKELGIDCAFYRVIAIKYINSETQQLIESEAVVTKIFKGPLVHYRDVRDQYSLGSKNDQLHDLFEIYNIQPELNDMFFIDYIFNQQDRHSKNFGLVNGQMSPIFDSGSCLFYERYDSDLSDVLYDMIPRHKTFSKDLRELLIFSLDYIYPDFSFSFDYNIIMSAFEKALQPLINKYTEKRLAFIKELVKRPAKFCQEVLGKKP